LYRRAQGNLYAGDSILQPLIESSITEIVFGGLFDCICCFKVLDGNQIVHPKIGDLSGEIDEPPNMEAT
jgi:hypothetical protein